MNLAGVDQLSELLANRRIPATRKSRDLDDLPASSSSKSSRVNNYDDIPIGRASRASESSPRNLRSSKAGGSFRELDDTPVGSKFLDSGDSISTRRPVNIRGRESASIDERQTGRVASPRGDLLARSSNPRLQASDFDKKPVGRSGRVERTDDDLSRSWRSSNTRRSMDTNSPPAGRAGSPRNGDLSPRNSLTASRSKKELNDGTFSRSRTLGLRSNAEESIEDQSFTSAARRQRDFDDSSLGRRARDADDLLVSGRRPDSGKKYADTDDLSRSRSGLSSPISRRAKDSDDIQGSRRQSELGKKYAGADDLRKDREELASGSMRGKDDTFRSGRKSLRAADGQDTLQETRWSMKKVNNLDTVDISNSARGDTIENTATKRRESAKPRTREALIRDTDKEEVTRSSPRTGIGAKSLSSQLQLKVRKLRCQLPANFAATQYSLVKDAAKRLGFSQCKDDDFESPYLIWTDSFISQERLKQLQSHQRINHFPSMSSIARKDELARRLTQLAERLPEEFGFAPRSWCLPAQQQQWQERKQELISKTNAQSKHKAANLEQAIICKPTNPTSSLQVTSIFPSASQVPNNFKEECVLQEFVQNPFLIDGRKFELRVFVLVTSCDPLRVYFYNEGIVRLSGRPYVEPSQRQGPEETAGHFTDSGRSRGATQRNFQYLNDHLQRKKCDVAKIWRSIVDIIVKTLLMAQSQVLPAYRRCRTAINESSSGNGSVCFELLGFDILLDRQLQPWLLEVNRSPSLDASNPDEKKMKNEMLQEMLMLLDVRPKGSLLRQKKGKPDKIPKEKLSPEQAERLRRSRQMTQTESRVCFRFRRIFPSDDPSRQRKFIGLLLELFPAQLARELRVFYDAAAADAARKLNGSQPCTDDEEEEEEVENDADKKKPAELLRKDGSRMTLNERRELEKAAAAKAAAEAEQQQLELQKQLKQQEEEEKEQRLRKEAENRKRDTEMALHCLNELRVKIPGKSIAQSERLLWQLQEEQWKEQKQLVADYWLLRLDAGKRERVLTIARNCATVAVGKCLGQEAFNKLRIDRMFEKINNWLLAGCGHNFWSTFSAKGSKWLKIVQQLQPEPSETELNCCRRLVQLCQDCLLIVYLYSHSAATGDETADGVAALVADVKQ